MTVVGPLEPRSALLPNVRGYAAAAVALLAALRPSVPGFACAVAVVLLAAVVSWRPTRGVATGPVRLGIEAALATVVVVVGSPWLPEAALYLTAPAFAAGLLAGRRGLALPLCCDLAVVAALALGPRDGALDLRVVAPLLIAAVGSGLLGAFVQQLEDDRHSDDAYDSARRLLGQLRTVARRLSAGLDPVGIAQQVLVEVSVALSDGCSVLLVPSEGGVLVPLTFRGPDRLTALHGDDPLVREVWSNQSPAQRWSVESGQRRVLVALPLSVGSRIVGLVVAECDASPSVDVLTGLQAALDQHALRLDSALVFDEIRTLATADERRRLAREIHDGIAQEVASLGYAVDELVATALSDDQREQLRSLRAELTRVVSELRLSIFDLRSEVSATTGVTAALSDYVRQVATRTGMTVHLSLNETPQRLRVEVEAEILRIAQEAVVNARRHSGAQNLWVNVSVDPPHATLTVTDDGHGIGTTRPDSYGMKIMRERAERIGAELTITARPEGGTIVDLTMRPDTVASLPPASPGASTPLSNVPTAPPATDLSNLSLVAAKEDPDGYVGAAHR